MYLYYTFSLTLMHIQALFDKLLLRGHENIVPCNIFWCRNFHPMWSTSKPICITKTLIKNNFHARASFLRSQTVEQITQQYFSWFSSNAHCIRLSTCLYDVNTWSNLLPQTLMLNRDLCSCLRPTWGSELVSGMKYIGHGELGCVGRMVCLWLAYIGDF